MEAKLEKMRNKRLLQTEMKGASVAQKLSASGEQAAGSSFADWVTHSRSLDKERQDFFKAQIDWCEERNGLSVERPTREH